MVKEWWHIHCMGQSGIMTFIVNLDGKVYQRNFAEKTTEIAVAMKNIIR